MTVAFISHKLFSARYWSGICSALHLARKVQIPVPQVLLVIDVLCSPLNIIGCAYVIGVVYSLLDSILLVSSKSSYVHGGATNVVRNTEPMQLSWLLQEVLLHPFEWSGT